MAGEIRTTGDPPATAAVARSRSDMEVLGDMGAFSARVLGEIGRATRRVDVECFIVRSDRLGRALAGALAAASARGVRCRLLYDPLGCRKTKRAYFRDLARAGVEVRRYGSIGGLLFGRPRARDHARVIVIDDVAYTGGHAWGDEWEPKARGGHGWQDVCCGVSGPIVEDFAELFERHWREAGRELEVDDYVGEQRDGLQLLGDAPVKDSVIAGAHLDALHRARRRIWIANAYFFPTPRFYAALVDARRRGVEVRILLPGVSDLPIIQWGARAAYPRWLREGLEIWEYQDVVMHSKYAVFDDDCCVIGTFNVNAISVLAALEVVLVSRVPAQVAAAAAQFERDLGASRQLDLDHARRRPLGQRMLDRLASWPLLMANRLLQRRPLPPV